MKIFQKLFALMLVLCITLTVFISCNPKPEEPEFIDYASTLKLDMNTDSLKTEATVKGYIDGDTTHFYVSRDVTEDGILKARYLAINTPESTGRIEPWGKAAAKFTRSKLETAVSIILESDDNNGTSTPQASVIWYGYGTRQAKTVNTAT